MAIIGNYRTYMDADTGAWIFLNTLTGVRQIYPNEAAAWRAATMADKQTGAQAWEAGIRNVIGVQGRDLIRAALTLSVDAQANDITTLIAETPDGELLPGTTILKEDAAALNSLMIDILTWLGGQATGSPEGTTRQTRIFRVF